MQLCTSMLFAKCVRVEQWNPVSLQLLCITAVYFYYYCCCYYCYTTGEQLNHVPKSVMKFGRAMAMNNGVSNYASNSTNGTSSSSASRPPPVITAPAAVPSQATPAATTGGGISAATTATAIEADKQSSAAEGSFTSSSMNGGSSSSMNDVSSDVHTLSSSSTATTAAAGTTGAAANGSSSDGSSSSSSGLLLAGELQLPVPLGALPHGALGSSAGSGLAITVGSDGSNDLERTDEEMSHVSLEGDELTLVPPGGAGTGGATVGTNGHAHHYLHHFDEFTNNDIVNQVRIMLLLMA
jgi:hypothetical protein